MKLIAVLLHFAGPVEARQFAAIVLMHCWKKTTEEWHHVAYYEKGKDTFSQLLYGHLTLIVLLSSPTNGIEAKVLFGYRAKLHYPLLNVISGNSYLRCYQQSSFVSVVRWRFVFCFQLKLDFFKHVWTKLFVALALLETNPKKTQERIIL